VSETVVVDKTKTSPLSTNSGGFLVKLPSVDPVLLTLQASTEQEALHRALVVETRDRANILLTEAAHRLKWYRRTKFASVTLLLGSLLGLVYTNAALGFEALALKATPVALFFGLLFFLINQYLKDHPVASRAAQEGEKLLNAVRTAEVAWTFAKDDAEKRASIDELMKHKIDTNEIIEAEKTSISDILTPLVTFSRALIEFRDKQNEEKKKKED